VEVPWWRSLVVEVPGLAGGGGAQVVEVPGLEK